MPHFSPDRMAEVYRVVAGVYTEAVQPLLEAEMAELGLKARHDQVNLGVEDASRKEAERVRGLDDVEAVSRRLREGRIRLQGPVYQRTN